VEGSTDADNDLSKSEEKYNSFNDFDRDDVTMNKIESPMFSKGFIGDDFDDDDEERYLYFYVNICIFLCIYIYTVFSQAFSEVRILFYVFKCMHIYVYL
jgi:hypothetical protein